MAEQPVADEIVQGQVGQVAGREVGVIWTAGDGSSAQIMIAGDAAGRPWEVRCDVRSGEVVPLGATLVEVAAIKAPQSGARGAVSFAARPASVDATAGIGDVVMLPAGGRLRLDGPSVSTATDLTVLAWQPDETRPEAVTAEWLPAHFAKADTPKSQIIEQSLRAGSSVAIGKNQVKVAAVQGAAANHRAWLVLRLAPR